MRKPKRDAADAVNVKVAATVEQEAERARADAERLDAALHEEEK